MKSKSITKIISLLLVVIMVSSCATLPPPGTPMTDDERQTAKNRCIAKYTVGGALLGAAGGALLGYLIGGGEGAVKGAIAGGITGGVIAFAKAWNHCIGLFSNLDIYPVADYKQTAQDIGYQPSQGDLVEIKDLILTPSTAMPGDTVNLTGKYIVMNADPNAKDIKVLIERGVAGFDEKSNSYAEPGRFEPTEKTIDASNRTNKLDGQFELPEKLPAGKYKLVVRVTALEKTVTDGAGLEVTKKDEKKAGQEKTTSTVPETDKGAATPVTAPAPAKTAPAPASATPPAAKASPGQAAPQKAAGEKALAESGKTAQAPTLKEAREAKKNQELEGRLFQDRTSKVWYLENEEGTYKLKDGKFVLISHN